MEDRKEQSKKHFNDTADTYDETFDGKYVQPMYQDLLAEILKHPKGNLLDVGCGNGNVLAKLQETNLNLYGIDLSENMIQVAKKRLHNKVELLVADSEKLPFEDNYFDLLICNASFHHYPNPKKVLREMHRVLKDGGILYIGEGYAVQPLRSFLNIYFHFSKSGDVHSYGKNELKSMMSECGFHATAIKETGDHSLLYISESV